MDLVGIQNKITHYGTATLQPHFTVLFSVSGPSRTGSTTVHLAKPPVEDQRSKQKPGDR